jgi:hypothetical protein
MKRREFTTTVERFMERNKITSWRYEQGGKHLRVTIEHGGRKFFVSLPGSTRNWNAGYDTVRRLRHALGLVGREARP